jgi:hypothetical protein
MSYRSIASGTRALALAMVLGLGVSGCGNLTAGGFGDVTVAVSGDDPGPAAAARPAPQMALLASTAPSSPATVTAGVEGHVDADFMLLLVAESGAVVQLGADAIEVRVDIRGESEFEAVDRQVVEATLYTELQIVFTDIRAEVQGLVIDGMPVPEVHVELDGVSLPVSRPIDLDVAPGQSARLTVDLNSLSWLEAVDPLLGTVDEAVFAALIDVVVE